MPCGNAAMCSIARCVECSHLAGVDMNDLNAIAVKVLFTGADIVHDPARIGRPDSGVCEDVARWASGDGPFGADGLADYRGCRGWVHGGMAREGATAGN